jgi:PqqD family protein of HPr-rel-A system
MAESLPKSSDPSAARFRCVPLGDVVAVYDRHSGRTHILDPLTAAVMEEQSLQGSESRDEALRQAVAARLGVDLEELPLERVGDSLSRLQSAGLC